MNNQERVFENRLRRMANRKGLALQKSNCRNINDIEYGKARLCDLKTGTIVLGNIGGYGRTLVEIEKYLMG